MDEILSQRMTPEVLADMKRSIQDVVDLKENLDLLVSSATELPRKRRTVIPQR